MSMKYIEKVMMWKGIRFVKNWLHDQGKWLSYLASIVYIGISAWFVLQIPGMSVMAVVYSLLFGVAAVAVLLVVTTILAFIIPDSWVDNIILGIDKLNSYKGGF